MRVAIAGAGIAGLAAALALAQRGFSVDIFEHAAALEEIGAGIQLSPNAMAVLERLGVAEELAPALTTPAAIEIHNGLSGGRLTRIPLGETAQRRYGAPYCLAHRADLQAALLGACRCEPRISIRLGASIEAVEPDDAGVSFRAGGELASAELLIAADGIDSRIRGSWFRHRGAVSAGYTAWRATLEAAQVLPGVSLDIVGLWLGAGAHLVHYGVNGGERLNLVVIAPDHDANDAGGPPKAAFGPSLRPLFDAVPDWRAWPLASVDPDRAWVRDRVVLMGDAAHAMLPSAAQGGAQALEDAWVLAAALGRKPTRVSAALAAYEALRKPRVRRIARSARINLRLYELQGAAAVLRDAGIAALPPKLHLARLDPIYAWQPGEIAPA